MDCEIVFAWFSSESGPAKAPAAVARIEQRAAASWRLSSFNRMFNGKYSRDLGICIRENVASGRKKIMEREVRATRLNSVASMFLEW
jgi:hypothetical protein